MLIGKHIALRAIERTDLTQLLEWRNQPNFRQFFREHRELSFAQQNQWFENTVLNDPKVLMFAIVNKDSQELLGACGLCYINTINRTADFSIYIGKDNLYLDDTYAPDVAKVLMQYAFKEVNLNKLWAEVYDFDAKKRPFSKNSVFKRKAGFAKTAGLLALGTTRFSLACSKTKLNT